MNLRTSYNGGYWTCVDDDTYDGAPDSGLRAHLIGLGRTEQEATASWYAEYADYQESLTMAQPDDTEYADYQESLTMAQPDILEQSASMPVEHDALDDKRRDDARSDDRE